MSKPLSLKLLLTKVLQMLPTLAPKASPALTGTPTAPTASSTTNNTQIATTAFVKTAVNASVTGVKGNEESSYRTGNVNLTPANIGAIASSATATLFRAYTSSITDANNASYNTIHRFDNATAASNCSHLPVSQLGWLITMGDSSTRRLQFYVRGNSTSTFYIRNEQTGTWSDWRQITTTALS